MRYRKISIHLGQIILLYNLLGLAHKYTATALRTHGHNYRVGQAGRATGQDRTWHNRAGQDMSEKGRARQDRAGQDRAGRRGPGRTWQNRAGQDKTGQGSTGQDKGAGNLRVGQEGRAAVVQEIKEEGSLSCHLVARPKCWAYRHTHHGLGQANFISYSTTFCE